MIKRILSIILLFIVSSIAIAQVKVAILPVADKSGEIKYAVKLMLTASLTSAISMTEGYEAYDRIDLSSILDEQSFQRTGLVSDSDIHKIGEMTGASYVLVTEAAYIDANHLVATAKIVNVESAKIGNSAVSIIDVGNTNQMLNDCKSLTQKLLGTTDSGNSSTSASAIKFVDLGLSVLWASCNLGATKPEFYGNYYAWGEVMTKAKYTKSNYKWYSSNTQSTTILKYNEGGYKNTSRVDNKTVLDLPDDVAAKFGKNWRIPTKEQWQELIDYCRWEWTTENGVEGYKVISVENGNSIFLPAACYRRELDGDSWNNYYWSTKLGGTWVNYSAYCLYFNEGRYEVNSLEREVGCPIRPVMQR